MEAFILTGAIFFSFCFIGFSVLTLFPPRLRVVQNALLSPAIGVATLALLVFLINRMGVPVKDFGKILVAFLMISAAFILIVKRPIFPLKHLRPFLLIFIVTILCTAFPMAMYGFAWVSYVNDDMTNYCLAAQRFFNHGFFDTPSLPDLFEGRDYSLAYWFMHVSDKVRCGSELLLALSWSVTGLNPLQIFMPLISALHLALISATAAMVAGKEYTRKTPIIAAALFALSPLAALGMLYQLIGQVGGLLILCAASVLLFRPLSFNLKKRFFIASIPALIVLSAFFIWYPEGLPFIGLGWVTYLLFLWKKDKMRVKNLVAPSILIGLMVCVVLNTYILDSLGFLFHQFYAVGGVENKKELDILLFPYYLVPTGLANAWGLLPIVGGGACGPILLACTISMAMGLFLWLFLRAIPSQWKKASPPLSIFIVMFLVTVFLFYKDNDFGLFKITMYIQPFFVGVISGNLSTWSWRETSKLSKIALAIVIMFAVRTQYIYIQKSTGESLGGLCELPYASRNNIDLQLRSMWGAPSKDSDPLSYYADITNVVLAKFTSFYTQGHPVLFISRNFYALITHACTERKWSNFEEIRTPTTSNYFELTEGLSEIIKNNTLLHASGESSIFNKFYHKSSKSYFEKIDKPKNLLIFIHSELGGHYYSVYRRTIAFTQLEQDPMAPGQTFSSLGRNILFVAVNPSKNPRVLLDITDTVVKQYDSLLPTPKVQDAEVLFVGHGAGRIYSEPITPTMLNNVPYVSIDMMRPGLQFKKSLDGLMWLYGRDISLDTRYITCFSRNISLVSDEDYQKLQPPNKLESFPRDLDNVNLEYSGIYEDGWLSERSFFILSTTPETKNLMINGFVPNIKDENFKTMLIVRVNGAILSKHEIGIGDFDIKLPIKHSENRQRIDLEFSSHQRLPGADNRISGGKLKFIGFTEAE